MKIAFKDGFEIHKKELDKKNLEELYDLQCDMIMSYGKYDSRDEIAKLEGYIATRIQLEKEQASE